VVRPFRFVATLFRLDRPAVRRSALIAGSLVALVLGYLVVGSRVDGVRSTGTTLMTEPETSGLVAPASTGADRAASGGGYVQFGVRFGWTSPRRSCRGPITITRGGTYSGCYQSTNPGRPAVRIATTAPVTLDHAEVRHAGEGVNGSTGARLTIINSRFQALDPKVPASQRAVGLYQPTSLVTEHNALADGHGIYVNGDNRPVSMIRIRYNSATDIGRYAPPDCCIQFAQFDKVTTPAAEIAWNRVTNAYRRSTTEDSINMFKSSGQDAAHPIDIHHNLMSGAYPRDGDGRDYAGGGIIAGDGGGNYIAIHHNRVVSNANYGVAIVGGHDNHLYANRLVSDGRADNGSRVVAPYAQGISLWNPEHGTMTNDDAHDNVVGWVRPDGRADWWLPACNPSSACTGNTRLPDPVTPAVEQGERDAWAHEARADGLTVGPVPTLYGGARVSIAAPAGRKYRIWSRIMAPDSRSNSFGLSLDGGAQVTVGGAAIKPSTWTWVDYRAGRPADKVDVTLSSGSHVLALVGLEPGVKVDRIIFTTDRRCAPTGTGDNCANPP
jgi:hypothetical protein